MGTTQSIVCREHTNIVHISADIVFAHMLTRIFVHLSEYHTPLKSAILCVTLPGRSERGLTPTELLHLGTAIYLARPTFPLVEDEALFSKHIIFMALNKNMFMGVNGV
jgi:hypothetical protein